MPSDLAFEDLIPMAIPRRNIAILVGFLCVLLSFTEAQRNPPLGNDFDVIEKLSNVPIGLEGFFQQQGIVDVSWSFNGCFIESPGDEVQQSDNGAKWMETAASFDASAETDSPGGNSKIIAEGSSKSSPDHASAKITINTVARGDDEVYGYFTTTTLSEGISGI